MLGSLVPLGPPRPYPLAPHALGGIWDPLCLSTPYDSVLILAGLMDPHRPPPIATHSTKRKFVEDEAELSPHLARVTLTTQASQTSLPSIYELQPDLPPPGPRHAQFSGDPRFPPLPSFPSTSGAESSNTWIPSRDEPPSAFSPEQAQLEIGDSDGDGDDTLRRPKQKRRRQALSCTG